MQKPPLHPAPPERFGTPLEGDTLFGQLCWTLRINQKMPG